MKAIVVKNLTKVYPKGNVKALSNVSFSVEEGKIVGYLGPNGAGKTTTINILSAAIPATSGEARIHGYDVSTAKEEVRNLIGLATQDIALDWVLTVYDNLDLFGQLYGIPEPNRREKIWRLLEDFDLATKANAKALTLSGGEARRLQIARALLKKPRVLFVDEPTLGLDPIGKKVALNYLKRLAANGATIFLASNEMEQVEKICDEIIFLYSGRLVDQGSPEYFINLYANQDIIEIFYQESLPEEVLQFLQSFVGVQLLKTKPLTLAAPREAKMVLHLMPVLVDSKMALKDIKIREPSLNDVFINLVEGLRNAQN
jgi:ABC-2 type transport system ATP-binding protein